MRKCPDCGFEFDDDKSFCPSCGKYMPRIKNPYPSAEENSAKAPAAPEQPAETGTDSEVTSSETENKQ